MQNALTGNPALPGKPSGPCNMQTKHTSTHKHAYAGIVYTDASKSNGAHTQRHQTLKQPKHFKNAATKKYRALL